MNGQSKSLSLGMLLAAGLAACSATDGTQHSSDDNLSGARPKITDTEFVTSMNGGRAMQPYNNIVDSTLSGTPCVETVTGTPPDADKPVPHAEVSIQQIASRSTLALDIGADATVKAGVAPGPSVEAGLHLLQHYDTSKSTLSFLLTSTKEIHQNFAASYRLTSAAEALLRSDAKRFTKQCGRGFINGTTSSATLYALVQVHVDNEDAAAAMAASIGGGKSVGDIGQVTGTLSTSVAALRDKLGLKVTVDVFMDGFSTTIDVPSLNMSDASPVTTAQSNGTSAAPAPTDPGAKLPSVPASVAGVQKALDDFGGQLKTMLNAAQKAQQDTIDGAGKTAPRLTKVSVVGYRTLATAAEDDAPFSAIDALLTNTSGYLQELVDVRQQMDDVVQFELTPFFRDSQTASLKTGLVPYNLRAVKSDGGLDRDKFALDPDTLRRTATAWRTEFIGDDDTTTRGRMSKLIGACFTSAENGDYSACDRSLSADALAAAKARLAKYAAEGRILPVVFTSVGPAAYWDRDKQCSPGWHVPSGKSEVGALSMVIPQNAQSGAAKIATWVNDPPLDCKKGPLYSVNGAMGSFDCHDDGFFSGVNHWNLPVMCVPRSGPFGLVSDKPGETADKF